MVDTFRCFSEPDVPDNLPEPVSDNSLSLPFLVGVQASPLAPPSIYKRLNPDVWSESLQVSSVSKRFEVTLKLH